MSKYYSDLKRKQTTLDFSPLQHRISCLASHQVTKMVLFMLIILIIMQRYERRNPAQ